MRALLLALAPAALLAAWSRSGIGVEPFYAGTIYPALAPAIQGVSGLAPFSLFEVLVLLGAAALLVTLARCRRRLLWLHGVAVVALWLVSFFFVTWGMNYARPSLIEQQGWNDSPIDGPITSGEIAALAAGLARDVRDAWAALPPDLASDNGSRLPHDRRTLARLIDRGYAQLDWLAYAPARSWESPPPKPVFLLFYPTGAAGMYSPWTAEAQYDATLPDANLPFTVAHELAHARGFAQEDEANLLAWAAGTRAGDPYLQYSASLGAFRYAVRALQRFDKEAGHGLWSTMPSGVRADIERAAEHARSKPKLTVELSNVTYDAYLKSQGVADGRRAYGRVVKLLVYASRDPAVGWPPRRK